MSLGETSELDSLKMAGLGCHIPEAIGKGDRRHEEAGLWAIDTVNHNCAAGVLQHLQSSAADLCLAQEVRTPSAESCKAQERNAKRAKWGLCITQAIVTEEGGVSAGVGIAARSHFGMFENRRAPLLAKASSEGRLGSVHVGVIGKGGLHLLSIYCWCSEGLTQRNLDVLQDAAQIINSLRGPWCLAGDFNFEPQALADCGWLQLVKGHVVAPSIPTCGKRVYDYFVVSVGLKHSVVGIAVIDDAGFYPHMPVRLYLKGRPRTERARVLVAPRKLPASIPQGCVFERVDVVEEDITIDRLAVTAFCKAEQEIVSLCGFEGRDAELSCGRAEGPKFVLKPAIGPPGSEYSRCTAVTAAWLCIATWLRHLVCWWDHKHEANSLGRKVRAAWARLCRQDWSKTGEGENVDEGNLKPRSYLGGRKGNVRRRRP